MPTAIAAGASASVTVPTGYTLSLSGSGVAVVANRAITQAISGFGTLGPWNYDQAVYVTASTAMTYDLIQQGASSASLTPAAIAAGATGVAGVTAGGALVGPTGAPISPRIEQAGGVVTLTTANAGGSVVNTGNLPLWVLIPNGLSNFTATVVQRGRGRVYVCPGAGVECNGVTGAGRYSTTRRGESLTVTQTGTNAFAVQYANTVTVINGKPQSGYFTRDTSAANTTTAAYSVTGDLVTVTDTAHGLTTRLNGRPVYLMASTGILASGVYSEFTYVDANTYTVRAPSAIPDGSTKTGTFSGAANFIPTNLVNEANTILIGGSGATYSVIGDIITVTWTAHGLTNTYNGASVHMSFSTGVLKTGVYRNFLFIDANTFSCRSNEFFATTQTGSLAANTAETNLLHAIIPGDTLGEFGQMATEVHVQHLANANNKTVRVRLGRAQAANGVTWATHISTSTQTRQTLRRSIYATGGTYILTAPGGSGTEASFDGTTVAGQKVSLDFGADQTYKLSAQVTVATDWVYVGAATVEVNRGATATDHGGLGGGFVGVNLSGMEFVSLSPPPASDYTYWAGKGVKRFRIPFTWERIAPTLSGALDPTYLGLLQTACANAAAVGGSVILDLHNYAKYNNVVIGSGPTQADLVDVWTRLATALVGTPGLHGYEIMNEPLSLTVGVWQTICQACIDAIRTVDTSTTIYAGGIAQSSDQALSTNESFRLYDPATRLILSAHVYPDSTSSGTATNYATESAAFNNTYLSQPAGVAQFNGTGRWFVSKWTQYVRQGGWRAAITETGAPQADDERWRSENMVQTLGYILSTGMPVYLWGGGSQWSPGYGYRLHPQQATPSVDMPQMAYVDKFIAAYNA